MFALLSGRDKKGDPIPGFTPQREWKEVVRLKLDLLDVLYVSGIISIDDNAIDDYVIRSVLHQSF